MPRSPRASRVVGLVAALVAGTSSVLATGCAEQVACPAIAWGDEARIRLTGAPEAVARVTWVRLCDDVACSRSAEDPRDPDADGHPPLGLPYESLPTGPGTWTVRLTMSTPDRVTLTAFAADASVLAEADADVVWALVGEPDACGGPSVSDPVELAIPG
jgi:hypothetical protein